MKTVLVNLGFRAHSGWAAMVAVSGSLDAPQVLARRRIVLADPHQPGAKQPYHAAAELPFPEAEALIKEAIEYSRSIALAAIRKAVEELRAQDHEVAECGILVASGRVLPALQGILASHALIHTAEGRLFREVLAWAAQECRLRVSCVPEKDLDIALMTHVLSLGRRLGPPWSMDQKYATAAALMAGSGLFRRPLLVG